MIPTDKSLHKRYTLYFTITAKGGAILNPWDGPFLLDVGCIHPLYTQDATWNDFKNSWSYLNTSPTDIKTYPLGTWSLSYCSTINIEVDGAKTKNDYRLPIDEVDATKVVLTPGQSGVPVKLSFDKTSVQETF